MRFILMITVVGFFVVFGAACNNTCDVVSKADHVYQNGELVTFILTGETARIRYNHTESYLCDKKDSYAITLPGMVEVNWIHWDELKPLE